MRKTNTFETLFGELLKILQLMEGKEMTKFQSELYKNTLHSAIEARKLLENPFLEPRKEEYCSYTNEGE